LSNRRTAP